MAELNRRTSAANTLRRMTTAILADGFTGDTHTCYQELASLTMHFERFTAAHDVLVGDAAGDNELEAHQRLWNELEDLYNPSVAKLNRLMAPKAESLVQVDSAELRSATMDLKLDPVTVPKFDGSLRNWLAFKDAVQTLIDKPGIPEYYKLQKLRESLVGDSLEALVGNLYTGGYQATWDELVRRYDNKKQLAELHVSRFVGIKPITIETGAGLLTVVDTVRESLRALRVMALPVDQWDALSVPIVTSKLPQVTQHAWGMHTSQKDIPKLDDLLEFVEKRAQSLSLDVIHWPGSSNNGSARGSSQRLSTYAPRLVKSKLAATSPGNCEFCDSSTHRISSCPKLLALPVAERFNKLRSSNLCFNCLRPGHATKVCAGGNCRNCQGRHHTLLCRGNSSGAALTAKSTSTPTAALNSSASKSQPPQNYMD